MKGWEEVTVSPGNHLIARTRSGGHYCLRIGGLVFFIFISSPSPCSTGTLRCQSRNCRVCSRLVVQSLGRHEILNPCSVDNALFPGSARRHALSLVVLSSTRSHPLTVFPLRESTGRTPERQRGPMEEGAQVLWQSGIWCCSSFLDLPGESANSS